MKKLLNILNSLYDMAGYDGLKHIVLSAVLTVGLNLFLHWWTAGVFVLTIGFLKEIYDSTGKGCSETKDVVCDLIGVIIGIL